MAASAQRTKPTMINVKGRTARAMGVHLSTRPSHGWWSFIFTIGDFLLCIDTAISTITAVVGKLVHTTAHVDGTKRETAAMAAIAVSPQLRTSSIVNVKGRTTRPTEVDSRTTPSLGWCSFLPSPPAIFTYVSTLYYHHRRRRW